MSNILNIDQPILLLVRAECLCHAGVLDTGVEADSQVSLGQASSGSLNFDSCKKLTDNGRAVVAKLDTR